MASEAPMPQATRVAENAALLPHLLSHDRALLIRLIALHLDYSPPAAQLAPPRRSAAHPDLGASPCRRGPSGSSTPPATAAWLAHHERLADQHLRPVALNALESLVTTARNQPEQRRAAQTLLRALDRQ